MTLKTNRIDCPAFVAKGESTVRELMAYRNSAAERTSLAEAILEPGCKTECHCHPLVEELYHFLQGKGRILVGDGYFDVEPGVSILHRPGVRHQT